jgi:glucosamine--fructose-6-phosphate aminotransferase (isomerizing)
MAVLGTALADDPESLDGELARVPDELSRLVEQQDGLHGAVELLAGAGDVLVSGRGLAMGSALELALKLEETCLRPVRGLSYADLRHGPIAVVDSDLAAVLLAAPDGPMLPAMTELAADLAARGARGTVGIGGDAGFARACDVALAGPRLDERIAPLALAAPGQVLVEALARRLGLDPDAPRGLSKVTQTD